MLKVLVKVISDYSFKAMLKDALYDMSNMIFRVIFIVKLNVISKDILKADLCVCTFIRRFFILVSRVPETFIEYFGVCSYQVIYFSRGPEAFG